jgi:hypothetical protein
MNAILKPFLRKFVIVFMYDILIYNSTLQKHASHLQVLQCYHIISLSSLQSVLLLNKS